MEPIPDGTRAHMTRVGGVVLIAGGVLGTIVALIAQEERFQGPIALGVSGITLLLAIGYLSAGDRAPLLWLYAGPPVGSVLIAAMIYLGGGGDQGPRARPSRADGRVADGRRPNARGLP